MASTPMDESGVGAIALLCHFCEIHGPTVVFVTQLLHSYSRLYTLPQSLHPPSATPQSDELSDPNSDGRISYHRVSIPRVSSRPRDIVPLSKRFDVLQSYVSLREGMNEASLRAELNQQEEQDQQEQDSKDTSQVLTVIANDPPATGGKGPACCAAEEHGFISIDAIRTETGTGSDIREDFNYYVSQRSPPDKLYAMARRVCVRSLSCELSPSREGPVLFSDETQHPFHAFSYMFRVTDLAARGQVRWYSLVLLMPNRFNIIASYDHILSAVRHIVHYLQTRATEAQENSKNDDPTTDSQIPMTIRQMTTRRGVAKPNLKSLVELLAQPDLFSRLHTWMSLTLKYCHVRFVEKNFFKGLVAVPDINNRQSQVLSRRSKSAFKITYGRLLSELGVEGFYRVLCAIVIGNQIIVRGNQPNQINAVLRLLEDLLPDACKQTLINQTNYQERWRCGLLGLSMDTPIPDCIDRSEILVMSIFESSDHEKISFEISTTAPDQRLTLAREYLEILSQNLPERLLWLAVQSKKEEWIHKSKLIYRLSKIVVNSKDPRINQFLHLLQISTADLKVLKFFTAGFRESLLRSRLWRKTGPE